MAENPHESVSSGAQRSQGGETSREQGGQKNLHESVSWRVASNDDARGDRDGSSRA